AFPGRDPGVVRGALTMLLLTAAEMRELDRATIEGGHATGDALMERAGAGVAEAMERRYGPALALRIVVLCGTGNNGGDGFVAARHLRARGAEIHVGLIGERVRVRGEARVHLDRLEREGVGVAEIGSEEAVGPLRASRSSSRPGSTPQTCFPCAIRALTRARRAAG